MGADHLEWARSRPGRLAGVDLMSRAVEHTKQPLELYGAESDVRVANAERLPFDDESFDVVSSDFADVCTRIEPSSGDTLEGAAGQRRRGGLLDLARWLWPRRLVRAALPRCGLVLMIEART